jgi:hypothetical protein
MILVDQTGAYRLSLSASDLVNSTAGMNCITH